jgi:hypothetical protein
MSLLTGLLITLTAKTAESLKDETVEEI